MSRGKKFTRQQQKNAAAAKTGLAKYLKEETTGTAAKIGSQGWVFDEYRKIYNKVCPACRGLITKTKGKAPFTDYCAPCQTKIKPHLETINTMLGQKK